MIDEHRVSEWIHTAKDLDGAMGMPSHDDALLSLRVTLEELFEQAEACGADVLAGFADIAIESATRQKARITDGDELNTGMIPLRDAIADTFVTACNMPVYAGLISISEADFNEVMRSNFTKFCETEADAELSVKKYAGQGREVIYKKKGDYYVIFDAKTGKILKGIHYEDPRLV